MKNNTLCALFLFLLPLSLQASPPLGIAPFAGESGEQIAARVLVHLQKQQKFTLVERGQLKKALEEIALGESGIINSESAAKIGEMTGIRYLIVGEIQKMKNKSVYSASARIVRVETGVLIGAAAATGGMAKIANELSSDLIRNLSIYFTLDNPESPYTVLLKLADNKAKYKVGEKISLSFKVMRHAKGPDNVYIQIYSINAHGAMTLIYPNKYSGGKKTVQVGEEYTFPAADDIFEWELTPPVGSESIQAIVTTKPVDLFNLGDSYLKEDFPQVEGETYSVGMTRGLVTKLKKNKLGNWSAAKITYELDEP